MLSEQMKKLTLLRAAMLKTRAEGLNINPPAMTRTDYDINRGAVFAAPVLPDPNGSVGRAYFVRHFSDPVGKKVGSKEIHLGKALLPGTATHELEHALTYILGEMRPPSTLLAASGYDPYVDPRHVKNLLAGVDPSDSEVFFPEWKNYSTAREYMTVPAEFTRAAVRLYNMGNKTHEEQIFKMLPSLHEKLQLLPDEVLKLLVPHTVAGATRYDTPGIVL